MNIFSGKPVNSGRQPELDLLRGFTAVLLVIVHTGLYLGNGIGKGLWTFCDIVGSEPCAPVLMVLMGISMVYSRHQSPGKMLRRGLRLFAAGYVLSFFRSILPLLILGNIDEWTSDGAFFVVDILQFAGLSFMLIAALKKLRFSAPAILAVSVVMCVINQFIMLPDAVSWNSQWITGLVNLFCPVTEWSCFPLFTWFVFPAFGLVFGEMLIRCTDKKRLYGCLAAVSVWGVAYVYYQFYRLYPDYTGYYWGNNFYYMGLKNVLLALLIVCFTLSFWFFADKILPDFIKRFLKFLSENLNAFYIVSWVIISGLVHAQAVFAWRFGTGLTVGIIAVAIIACAWLTKLWLRVKKEIDK